MLRSKAVRATVPWILIVSLAAPVAGCGSPKRRGGITKKQAESRALAGEGLVHCPRPVRVECRVAPHGWRCKQFLPGRDADSANETTIPDPGPVSILIEC
jgi:hypothetical protein